MYHSQIMAITISSSRMAAIAATLLLIVACHGTSAKAPPAPPALSPAPVISDCFRALVNTSDCLSFVKAESNLTKPDKGCCPEIAGVVESNPICLCELLGHPEAIGLNIDVKKALKLPSLCGVSSAPNVSTCSAAGVPVSLAPRSSISPSDQPDQSAPSPSEEATLSSLGNEDDGASTTIKASAHHLFIFGLATSFISIFF